MTPPTIAIDRKLCTNCGHCVDVCGRVLTSKGEAIIVTDPAKCLLCGHCMAICPVDAVRVSGLSPYEFDLIETLPDSPDPDSLMGLFRRRRSIRRYQNRPVEKEKIVKIIEAGRFAPTGGNIQPFLFSVIQNPEALQSIRRMIIGGFVDRTNCDYKVLGEKMERGEVLSVDENLQYAFAARWRQKADDLNRGVDRLLFNAPVLISLYVPSSSSKYSTEVGLVGMQMVLMAESLGLGTCFIGWIAGASVGIGNSLPEVKKAMHIPEGHTISLSFVTGYSDFEYLRVVSRKPARITWV